MYEIDLSGNWEIPNLKKKNFGKIKKNNSFFHYFIPKNS